ncbi:hypothetical protein [Xenorhabdus sp. KJ12.1]|uniref:hypothetical protein n=1 Tax=Xenorhabdus sp. KJ12.1 TaxID=1851571 RepID=UPI000C04D83E|nr:hypothetical protein [Xenorhabdus sp. KJ12.1]PHM72330.1 hypothetical protein Xekj_00608 [Xenorhabdus sp. KJ12.1]
MLRWTPEQAEEYAKHIGISVVVDPVVSNLVPKTVFQEQPAKLTPQQRAQALGRMKDGMMNFRMSGKKRYMLPSWLHMMVLLYDIASRHKKCIKYYFGIYGLTGYGVFSFSCR